MSTLFALIYFNDYDITPLVIIAVVYFVFASSRSEPTEFEKKSMRVVRD